MDRDAGAASERPSSPDPAQLNLLQSACRSLQSASQPAGDADATDATADADATDAMNRPPNGAAAADSPAGPPPGAAPQNEASDADIFFECDVGSGAAGSASGGATGGADGGADTGCALTSPAGGSRDPSPVPQTGAPAAAAAAPGDHPPVRSEAMPVPGGGRSGADFSHSAGGAVPLPAPGRRGGSLGHRPQQSPSEKVDAWLRACHEDSGASAEEDEGADEAAAGHAPEEPQFVLDEDRASAFEDSSETEEMVDAVGVDEVHDLRELMARGLQLLDLDPNIEPPAAAAPALAHEAEEFHDEQLEGAVGGCEEDADAGADCERTLDCHYPRFAPGELARGSEGAKGENVEDDHAMSTAVAEVRGAEGGEARGAEGGDAKGSEAGVVVDAPDADDEAASTSGGSSSFAAPDLLKRSTSLKSGKTPPQTPGGKKFVRFADAMGLDLQRVHTFRDEIPIVPAAAFRGLDTAVRAPSPPPPPAPDTFQMSFGSAALGGDDDAASRLLVPMFLQPGGSLGFLDRLRRDRVVLENVLCNNTDFTINAIVRVLNMDFHKVVYVRHTLNEWQTSAELQAEYVPGSCDGLSDRFRFMLHAGALSPGERVQFVVRFECQGAAFWDNNGNENYSVQMIRSASTTLDEQGDWSGGRL